MEKIDNSIAVLMTVHNRKEKTISCLTALFNCILPDEYGFDVFLVDDGSTDGTAELIKKTFPQVNIVQGDGNLFWNRGMYLAWETAAKANDYDYYLWLNDDTILYPGAIYELVLCSENENDKSIICGTTCASIDKNKITYGGRRLDKKNVIIPSGEKQYCDCFNGNIVLIPKPVYKIAGMNDPLFHHALGDLDYGLRSRKLGIKSLVAPNILGECDEHTTLEDWRNSQTPLLKRLKLLYSPLGNHPIEFFKYTRRHKGLFVACLCFVSNHLKTIFNLYGR
jgi:GT2 family glycosyltransferase